MDSFAKFFSILGLCALLILAVFTYRLRWEQSVENGLLDMTTEFVNECQTTGKIDPLNYEMLARKCGTLGNYSISMEYSSIRAIPQEDGSYTREYLTYNEDDILSYMFNSSDTENFSFEMKTGDKLTVSIIKNSTLKQNIFHLNNGIVFVRYSGVIGNNG